MSICLSCCKKFKNINLHLQRNPTCQSILLLNYSSKKLQQNINNGPSKVVDANHDIPASPNSKIFDKYKCMKENMNEYMEPDMEVYIKLLHILMELDVPLKAYAQIMNWAVESYHSGHKFSFNFPSREKVISKLSSQLHMDDMKPTQTQITICNDEKVKVTHFNFEEMCLSLLSDENLMLDENLTFHNENPLDYKRKDTFSQLTCIEDGEIYQNTASKECTQDKDFCLGIKLFIDATHTDVHSNWMLDPVMFTFTFFNNDITRKSSAWRPLGFITDFGKTKLHNNREISARDKVQDFHSQLLEIFQSLITTQTRNGFYWELKYKDKIYPVTMKPVIILVVGDCQGNHKLAGMYGSFTNTNRLNHSCNCPKEYTDDPGFQCDFVKQSNIRKLCITKNNHELKKLSQHCIENAFDHVVIGDHEAGINALMPAEILHQFLLGMLEYALEEFFNLFTRTATNRIDAYGLEVFLYFKHNSDRSIPGINFKNGFTSLTKQKGTDKLSVCLLCLVFLNSKYSKKFQQNCEVGPSDYTMSQYRALIQRLLIYSEWMTKSEYNQSELVRAEKQLRVLMQNYKTVIKRESGVQLKLSKFHEILHVVRDIQLFGPAIGYDGRPGESAHKFTKKSAKHTQRRKGLFENQTAMRMYENLVITKAHNRIWKNLPDYMSDELHHKPSHITREPYNIYVKDNNIITSLTQRYTYSSNIYTRGCEYVYTELKDIVTENQMKCYSCIKVESVDLYRAHPCYQGSNLWFDWAYFSWEYSENEVREIPGRIISFVDLTTCEENDMYEKDVYACIISMKDVPKDTSRENSLIAKGSLETDSDGYFIYRLISISTIVRPCCCIPDIENLDKNDDSHKDWLCIHERGTWSQKF